MEQHRQRFSGEITNASAVVNTQLSKLTMLERKFSNLDDKFSLEISNLMKNGNNARAKALANELVNIQADLSDVHLASEWYFALIPVIYTSHLDDAGSRRA